MLDEADFIARYDKHDALGVLAAQPDQLRATRAMTGKLPVGQPQRVVVAGMGGSAIGAEFVKDWLIDHLPVPLEIVRQYALPGYVDKHTLVICSSSSGNTEETLAALGEAQRRGAMIVVMASGGKLLEEARRHELPYFALPSGLQPRMAVWYGVRALAQLLEALKLVSGIVEQLEAAATWLGDHQAAWLAGSPMKVNAAKQLAIAVVGHPIVVYGGEALRLPTMKWKIDFNENAKNIAFYNIFPEVNHNEFIGWGHPEQHGLKVIELRSNREHERIEQRFDVTNRLLSNRFAPIIVQAMGDSKLEQILWTSALGDFASVYLAILNGIDPTPVDLVEKLKKELG